MSIGMILIAAVATALIAALLSAKADAKKKFGKAKVGSPQAKCPPKPSGDPEFEKATSNINIVGDDAYKKKVKADLKKIYKTPSGKKMLESLNKSKKTVTIKAPGSPDDGNSCSFKTTGELKPDGKPGDGSNSTVRYNPDRDDTGGGQKWNKRPPAIGLAHELVHADQAAHGRFNGKLADNDSKPNPSKPGQKVKEKISELEAAGIPPHDKGPYSENSIRKEWKPKQPQRKWY